MTWMIALLMLASLVQNGWAVTCYTCEWMYFERTHQLYESNVDCLYGRNVKLTRCPLDHCGILAANYSSPVHGPVALLKRGCMSEIWEYDYPRITTGCHDITSQLAKKDTEPYILEWSRGCNCSTDFCNFIYYSELIQQTQTDEPRSVYKEDWFWPVVGTTTVLLLIILLALVIAVMRLGPRASSHQRLHDLVNAEPMATPYEQSLESTYGPPPPPYEPIQTVSREVSRQQCVGPTANPSVIPVQDHQQIMPGPAEHTQDNAQLIQNGATFPHHDVAYDEPPPEYSSIYDDNGELKEDIPQETT